MTPGSGTPAPAIEVVLRRRFGWQIASFVEIVGMSAILIAILVSGPDTPILSRIAATMFPLFFIVVGMLTFVLFPIPTTVEADISGIRLYRRNRLRVDLPWSRVKWVAFGTWSVAAYTVVTRKNARCLLIRGPTPRRSIGMNDATYTLTSQDLAGFANAVVHFAQSHAIPILPRARL